MAFVAGEGFERPGPRLRTAGVARTTATASTFTPFNFNFFVVGLLRACKLSAPLRERLRAPVPLPCPYHPFYYPHPNAPLRFSRPSCLWALERHHRKEEIYDGSSGGEVVPEEPEFEAFRA